MATPKVGNRKKGHRSMVHALYYKEQFLRTAQNKARRLRRRTHRLAMALAARQAKWDKNMLKCMRYDSGPRANHPRPIK